MRKERSAVSKFYKVRCPECSHEQTVFSHAKTLVCCHLCDAHLIETTGGKAKILGEITEEMS